MAIQYPDHDEKKVSYPTKIQLRLDKYDIFEIVAKNEGFKKSELIEKVNRYYLNLLEKNSLKKVKYKSISYRPSKNVDYRLKKAAKKLGIFKSKLQQYFLDDYINSFGDLLLEEEEKNSINISLRHDPNNFNDIKKAAKITGILNIATYIQKSVSDNLWKCLKCGGRLMKIKSANAIACTKCGDKPFKKILSYLKNKKNKPGLIRKITLLSSEYNEIAAFIDDFDIEVSAFISIFSHMIAKRDINNSENNYPKIITDLMFSMQ